MTENEARYIVRMINAFQDGRLFSDATDEDAKEFDRMKARYSEAGGWGKGRDAALCEFILRVSENGVPGGEYLSPQSVQDQQWMLDNGYDTEALIERPSKGVK